MTRDIMGVAELGERHGISSTRVLQMVRDGGIERRPGREPTTVRLEEDRRPILNRLKR